ncbi:hypothetical protein P152DRAFT_474094 [Eremomyces bilateralis CBS 781.70]|uniref:Uncharacterized protein n=1 Tax=Eremomyces bilateralis CBS 781.70 TaxID=1392243 RepID=A0A6G1G2X1_9PEZI|nr:uncharacterized protein P152DRAFT_474094 [Eremomyces bilateralis CBS 781.70]KAF1812404.1 hypothetical protein P152DRAFT_474094 [Eremomyces bilateralis CBS 781.70]
MASWDIPFSISSADLESFHSAHFPEAPIPVIALQALESRVPEAHELGEDDDWLGHYPDGVKRTVTDDEVAIFRHSEIQGLLRQRRQAAENEQDGRLEQSKADGTDTTSGRPEKPSHLRKEATVPHSPASSSSGRQGRKRKHNQTQRKARKRTGYEDRGDPDGRTFRRIAREMDELNAEAVDLDY